MFDKGDKVYILQGFGVRKGEIMYKYDGSMLLRVKIESKPTDVLANNIFETRDKAIRELERRCAT